MVAHALLPAVGLAVKVPAHSTLVSVGVSMPIMSPSPSTTQVVAPPTAHSVIPPFLRHEWATPSTSISITSPTGKQDIGQACNELARLREYTCHVRHDDRACRDVAKIMRLLGCDLPTNIKPGLNLSVKLRLRI
jgi:hypothetical protein